MASTDVPSELTAGLATLFAELESPDTSDAASKKLGRLKVMIDNALTKHALLQQTRGVEHDPLPDGAPAAGANEEPPAPAPTPTPTPPPVPTSTVYIPIDKFMFDPGEYNSKSLSIYITAGMDNIVDSKDSVSCDFSETSFDLKVMGHNGKNFRLNRDNLAHSIDPLKSKYLVKQSKIIVKLAKCKGEFSYDHWESLCAKPGSKKGKKKEDPQASIMSMMKDMYDGGDEDMKRMIGESMLKSQRGEKMDLDGTSGEL
ncbi:hypothetical protein TrRE_jg10016 [Triparma retinervis]|uniref:Calcyclin-binding protein n=1 Tax=Triparma retinervis TaxID=2557542 RepID=A0A9W6ZIT4_9STRA|nr:hypothetical protein TrRE_jg10016 [Triparma retinervis]